MYWQEWEHKQKKLVIDFKSVQSMYACVLVLRNSWARSFDTANAIAQHWTCCWAEPDTSTILFSAYFPKIHIVFCSVIQVDVFQTVSAFIVYAFLPSPPILILYSSYCNILDFTITTVQSCLYKSRRISSIYKTLHSMFMYFKLQCFSDHCDSSTYV